MRMRSAGFLLFLLFPCPLFSQEMILKGRVVDPQGNALPKADVQLVCHNRIPAHSTSGPDGRFEMKVLAPGKCMAKVNAAGFRTVSRVVVVHASGNQETEIGMSSLSVKGESVTVTADVTEGEIVSPDPAMKVFATENMLDANPGRPGAPISVPGFPIETASGGIKAPQYFAPGVAGDHGEPIAQYVAVGSYLLPNNLSANAHGNGYSDPNIYIPEVLESVQVDGGAFNVLEGNHSVNLAATYGIRSHIEPFITLAGDQRDIAGIVGISPSPDSFIAVSGAFGNGFLGRLEHRQQYKINGERVFHLGDHQFTLFGIGYYGSSFMAGLVPIEPYNSADTGFSTRNDSIDPRQKDQTHTTLLALNDVWKLHDRQRLQFSGFFRTYNLSLYTNFGLGLIRQSEFRTVTGGSSAYVNKVSEHLTLLAGADYLREAPRRDNLDRYDFFHPSNPYYYGPFTKVDSNNITISSVTPYAAADGSLSRFVHYYLGWRRDEIDIDNEDLLTPAHSFNRWVGVNSPKATVSFFAKQSGIAPAISLSYGESFFTEDPRIGSSAGQQGTIGSPVARSHCYQLVANKTIHRTDVKLTLGHVTNSAELAKIDSDTGLQENEGPSRLRFASLSLRQSFRYGSLLATFSKADSRGLDSGEVTPEAPRTIADLTGTIDKLPFLLQAKGEFEYVGSKALGTGCDPNIPAGGNAYCVGVPIKEFRVSLTRPFHEGRINVGLNMLIATGYTGQTTEPFYNFATQQPNQVQEIVGVRIPSYASVNITYRFRGAVRP